MIDPDTIIRTVADVFGVSVADIRGHRRFQRHMRARHAVAYLLIHAGYGVTEAGELLGRHYSTVSSSVDAADDLIDTDETYAAQIRACQAALSAPTPLPRTVAETVVRRRGAWIIDPNVQISAFWFGGVPEVASA